MVVYTYIGEGHSKCETIMTHIQFIVKIYKHLWELQFMPVCVQSNDLCAGDLCAMSHMQMCNVMSRHNPERNAIILYPITFRSIMSIQTIEKSEA